MPTRTRKRVWIETGCIQCNWCSDLSPEVFAVGAGSSVVRADAREDGETDRNPKRCRLSKPLDETAADFLDFVAAGCPVQVIRIADD